MKWIGQHIWDFISRFRSDVYLENLSTTSEAELLVVDSDGKVSKKNQSTIVIDTSDFLDNAADNRVVTATGAADGSPAIKGEGNLTFDGTTLTLAGLIDMTSTSGIDIASTATTTDAFEITANSLTTGRFIDLTQTDTSTASATCTGLTQTAYTKSGVTGDGNTRDVTGHNILLVDSATNHANATSTLTGMQIQSSFVNNAGTTTAEGINIVATGADTNIGLTTKVTDGDVDIKCMSSADTGDYFAILTTTHGATTLTTVDDDATAANLTLIPDGKVVIQPADISGDVFHLDADADTDNVVNIDAGVLDIDTTGNITIDSASTIQIQSAESKINTIYDFHDTTFENQLSSGAYSGKILKYSPGGDTTLTAGQIYYLRTNGNWVSVNADDDGGGGPGDSQLLGVGLGASSQTVGALIEGFVRVPATEILNTPGSGNVDGLPLYVSTTAGHFDFTAPSDSGDYVRVVGYAIDDHSSDVLVYFNPSKTWIEIA